MTLQASYDCPSCWEPFQPEEIHWIAQKVEGDSHFAKGGEKRRFLPRHFRINGNRVYAVDENGGLCQKLACPHCHIEFPSFYLKSKPFTISMVGGTSTGKTHYLVSLHHWLQSELGNYGLSYRDGFSTNNKDLQERCQAFFPGTGVAGQFAESKATIPGKYDEEVLIENPYTPGEKDKFTYPKPFMYSMTLQGGGAAYSLCLYDHAGENFRHENTLDTNRPVTQHVAGSDAIFFFFDPTQIYSFVDEYKNGIDNEKLVGAEQRLVSGGKIDVHDDPLAIFEAMENLMTSAYDGPLVILVPKCDAWMDSPAWKKSLQNLSENARKTLNGVPISPKDGKLLINDIREISEHVKQYLQKYYEKFIHAVQRFSSEAVYIPVSATGCNPQKINGIWGFHSGQLKPRWVGIPFMYALLKHGLIESIMDTN